jgi:hypothetical protein
MKKREIVQVAIKRKIKYMSRVKNYLLRFFFLSLSLLMYKAKTFFYYNNNK